MKLINIIIALFLIYIVFKVYIDTFFLSTMLYIYTYSEQPSCDESEYIYYYVTNNVEMKLDNNYNNLNNDSFFWYSVIQESKKNYNIMKFKLKDILICD